MEKRIVFSLGDIARIRLECPKPECGGEVILRIDSFPPSNCPLCFQG